MRLLPTILIVVLFTGCDPEPAQRSQPTSDEMARKREQLRKVQEQHDQVVDKKAQEIFKETGYDPRNDPRYRSPTVGGVIERDFVAVAERLGIPVATMLLMWSMFLMQQRRKDARDDEQQKRKDVRDDEELKRREAREDNASKARDDRDKAFTDHLMEMDRNRMEMDRLRAGLSEHWTVIQKEQVAAMKESSKAQTAQCQTLDQLATLTEKLVDTGGLNGGQGN